MPVAVTYPGLYVQELPAQTRTIVGVSTSVAAFIDFFARGPMNTPVQVTSLTGFQTTFGGLHTSSEASYAIQQFFLNGGSTAWIVRVAAGTPTAATATLSDNETTPAGVLLVSAVSPGQWGNDVQVIATQVLGTSTSSQSFNLLVQEVQPPSSGGSVEVVRAESYLNVVMDPASPLYAVAVVNDASALVQLKDLNKPVVPPVTPGLPAFTFTDNLGRLVDKSGKALSPSPWQSLTNGTDGNVADAAAMTAGLSALDRIAPQTFNIMCLPGASTAAMTIATTAAPTPGFQTVIAAAAQYCVTNRAFLIVDIPQVIDTQAKMLDWMASNDSLRSPNAAVYFPRLTMPDALAQNRLRNVGAGGTLAGIYASTDLARGVWKAPAGSDAVIVGANLAVKLTDLENGPLNGLGINVLRNFPVFGNIVWGARTTEGADQLASQWKYISVRRLTLYIEESLFESLRWVVFEPNDEPLWAQIRLAVDDFLSGLFRQGAFQGSTPAQAYFVGCDATTTTQSDIERGVVNIVVGFAPVKPAEFVILQIQQMAGQASN